jgi:hypothetical protein
MAPQTFGARFLTEFRHLGGSTEGWPETSIAALNDTDRRRFVALLEGRRSQLSAELLVAAHTAEPEALAKRGLARAADKKGQSDLTALVGLIAAMSAGS